MMALSSVEHTGLNLWCTQKWSTFLVVDAHTSVVPNTLVTQAPLVPSVMSWIGIPARQGWFVITAAPSSGGKQSWKWDRETCAATLLQSPGLESSDVLPLRPHTRATISFSTHWSPTAAGITEQISSVLPLSCVFLPLSLMLFQPPPVVQVL